MYDLLKRYRLFFTIVVSFVFLLFLLFKVGESTQNSTLQSIAQTITFPFQVAVNQSIRGVSNVSDSYLYLVNLKKENEALRRQVAMLREEVNQYIEESIQYNRLKVQLEFAETQPDRKIFSEVIGESVDNFHRVLLINRGSEHDIKRNFAVILREGVVGRIQSVSRFQSTVQLILDHRSRFPAIVQRTRVKGIVYGTRTGLELRRINLRADIKEGDRVVTNGLSGMFSKGLLVGIVSEVERKEHELFQSAKLTPLVDFDRIEGVFVVTNNNDSERSPLFTNP